jgi:signal transduction histidine kinase/CheY-like chemotaxis protein/purine-cytosine permease-like protein
MSGRQRIVRVRRQYNQWVANQTLEDYALRFTATGARRWSSFRVANTALGAISFLACEAIGGTLTLDYGFANTVWAITAVSALIFLTGLPIGYYAVRHGVDVDLLARGAGFGYIGSTITSLIYASFTFLLFSVEAVIMALALQMCLGLPLPVGYVVCALVVVPIVTFGIRFISRMQLWTQPIWLILQIGPLAYIVLHDPTAITDWTRFAGRAPGASAGFDLLLFGAAASVLLSLAPQIGEQADYLRFLPAPRPGDRWSRVRWWLAMLPAGPGWIVLGAGKLLAGSILAVFALHHGVPFVHAAEPAQVYRAAFEYLSLSPQTALVLTGVFVVTCQIKINVTNMYAGSIAWSNFFSRLTHSHPGRVVWVLFNVALALLLMELGIFQTIAKILGLYSNFAVAWIGALVADLVVNKPLGLSPPTIEFRRAHLYDINPVGVGAMALSILVSSLAFFGLFGPVPQSLAPFIGFFLAFAAAPVIAWATAGRYYIARQPEPRGAHLATDICCICENRFEGEDMSYCPAYAGPICSLCCTLDARCHDACKPHGRIGAQAKAMMARILPPRVAVGINARVGRFLGVFLVFNLVIAAVLGATYYLGGTERAILPALTAIYVCLFIILGIAAWLMVLAQESRHVAEEESQRQTHMLTLEIEAHERTDALLQQAKETAEAANFAKSRYITGLNHEIRAPLNAIFGYAQLLEQDGAIPPHRHDAVRVIRRSAEHLSYLVDGLLDISNIEAGRLHLNHDRIATDDFLNQIVDMFRLQAQAKNVRFIYEGRGNLPATVHADQNRLRQVLINLLSNAIKYTETGHAALRVTCKSSVAEFEIADTGIGIPPEDLKRIFEPFERGRSPGAQAIPGTGLGLTIAKLLTEVMGGEISVRSRVGEGSVFRVRLYLPQAPEVIGPAIDTQRITGYRGRRIKILTADDDPAHLDLLADLLTPLGFMVMRAASGTLCLEAARHSRPDLVLLDLSLPGLDGWETARALRREVCPDAAILLVSGRVEEFREGGLEDDHDGFLIKPIDLRQLLDKIRLVLRIEWIVETPAPVAAVTLSRPLLVPERKHIDDLLRLGRIGYVRGIEAKLAELEALETGYAPFVAQLRDFVRNFALKRYMSVLETLELHDP